MHNEGQLRKARLHGSRDAAILQDGKQQVVAEREQRGEQLLG